jgi:hypothetical protein
MPPNRKNTMQNMRNIGAILAVAGLYSFPLTAQAQGIPGGAARGAEQALSLFRARKQYGGKR